MPSNRQSQLRPRGRTVRERTPLNGRMGATRDTSSTYGDAGLRRRVVRERTPIDGESGGTRDTTTTYEPTPEPAPEPAKRRSVRQYSPTRAAETSTAGIGLLEAEFFVAIGLLVLLMFANSSASYTDRIMSLMKRGSLTCLLFFALALVSSAGVNAAKVAKAFGGLVIVAILVTSPVGTVITDVDALVKNDWVGTSESSDESASGSAPSADTGTGSTSASSILNAIKDGLQDLQRLLGPLDPGNAANALKNALHL